MLLLLLLLLLLVGFVGWLCINGVAGQFWASSSEVDANGNPGGRQRR